MGCFSMAIKYDDKICVDWIESPEKMLDRQFKVYDMQQWLKKNISWYEGWISDYKIGCVPDDS